MVVARVQQLGSASYTTVATAPPGRTALEPTSATPPAAASNSSSSGGGAPSGVIADPPADAGQDGGPYTPSGADGGGQSPGADHGGSRPPPEPAPAIIVRAEEALIVLLVLVLWVGAIALFFNRWGKIRMLEPYQPKFQQDHRPSCPMGDIAVPIGLQHRTFSKFNLNYVEPPVMRGGLLRPRQNSVFVGSATMVSMPANPPRKTKSAVDIQTLVLAECGPAYSDSLRDTSPRRPSCSRLHVTPV